MLDVLRKQASSWITKFILGAIAIVFIFFFGSQTLRDPREAGKVAAKVNGISITQTAVNGYVRLEKDQNPLYRDLPEELQTQLGQMALSKLIQSAIVESEARKMGLRVSREEIAGFIRKDPGFSRNGAFDSLYYHEKFRPGYRNRYGIDYETFVEGNLLRQKFRDIFVKTAVIRDEEAKNRFAEKNTRIAVKKITISPEKIPTAKDLAHKLWPLFQSQKLGKDMLKEHGLTEEESPPVSLLEYDTLFPGLSDPQSVAGIFGLSEKNPVPDKPLEAGGAIYFVRLVKKETPDWKDFEKMKPQIVEELKEEEVGMLFSRWYKDTAGKADIKINR